MSKVIKSGEIQSIQVGGKTVRGFSVGMYLRASAVNTALSTTDYNWRNVTVKSTLKRGNKEYVLVSTTLDVLQQVVCYNDSEYFISSYSNQTKPAYSTLFTQVGVLTYPDVAVKGLYYIPVDFKFPSVINLTAGDVLNIEVNCNDGTFQGNADTALSYLLLSEIEAVGVEFGIPMLKTLSIQPNQENLTLDLGSNVDELYFINLDKTNPLTANQVIQSVTLASDKLKYTKQYIELLGMRSNSTNRNDPDRLGQTFRLSNEIDLDGANVTIQFNTANVNTGMNYIALLTSEYHPESLALSDAKSRLNSYVGMQRKGMGSGEINKAISDLQSKIANLELKRRK